MIRSKLLTPYWRILLVNNNLNSNCSSHKAIKWLQKTCDFASFFSPHHHWHCLKTTDHWPGLGMTWTCANDNNLWILGWTIPLTAHIDHKYFRDHPFGVFPQCWLEVIRNICNQSRKQGHHMYIHVLPLGVGVSRSISKSLYALCMLRFCWAL